MAPSVAAPSVNFPCTQYALPPIERGTNREVELLQCLQLSPATLALVWSMGTERVTGNLVCHGSDVGKLTVVGDGWGSESLVAHKPGESLTTAATRGAKSEWKRRGCVRKLATAVPSPRLAEWAAKGRADARKLASTVRNPCGFYRVVCWRGSDDTYSVGALDCGNKGSYLIAVSGLAEFAARTVEEALSPWVWKPQRAAALAAATEVERIRREVSLS